MQQIEVHRVLGPGLLESAYEQSSVPGAEPCERFRLNDRFLCL